MTFSPRVAAAPLLAALALLAPEGAKADAAKTAKAALTAQLQSIFAKWSKAMVERDKTAWAATTSHRWTSCRSGAS